MKDFMGLALTFALCSLCFTALNDFVFKLFANKLRSMGSFIFLVGCISALSMACLPQGWEPLGKTLAWGALGGFFSLTANILLIEAMARQSAGLCSTIFRLNMVFVVIGAFFLLGESITALQWLGIGLAVAAIVLFLPFGSRDGFNRTGFLLVVVASLLRAVMGLVYKMAMSRGVHPNTMALLTDLFWVVGGLIYLAVKERDWRGLRDGHTLKMGLLSGILVAGIVFCMANSLHLGDASKVLPIAQMSFLATFVLGVVFLHERFSICKVLALISGVGSVACIIING